MARRRTASTRTRSEYLREKVERIADEASGDIVRVIVQMENSLPQLRDASQMVGKRYADRMAVATARDLLPTKRRSVNQPRAKAIITPSIANGYRAKFQKDVNIKLAAINTKRKITQKYQQPFWTSRSIVMDMKKIDLENLARSMPGIADIYPNRVVRIPPVNKARGLPIEVDENKAYTWGLAKTGALASWGVYNAKGSGSIVAILDTGVEYDHPAFSIDGKKGAKIANFAEFDKNGDKVRQGTKMAIDDHGHGTHCAGIVVGGKESGRWIGMAPDAKVIVGRVLPKGLGTDVQILAGIEWAIESGADVISLSLGGLQLEPSVLDTYTLSIITANERGIPVCVSVGNEGQQTSSAPGNDLFAFTVGATDYEDRAAGFSGGRTQMITESKFIDSKDLPMVYSKPDVSAPGVNVYSAIRRGKYEAWNGTSMAAPHVAGAIALLLGKQTKIRNVRGDDRTQLLQGLIVGTVRELGEAGQNHRFGYGRIDVLRAYGYAEELGYVP